MSEVSNRICCFQNCLVNNNKTVTGSFKCKVYQEVKHLNLIVWTWKKGKPAQIMFVNLSLNCNIHYRPLDGPHRVCI